MKLVLIFAFCLIAFALEAQVIYQPHRRKDFRIAVATCSTYNTTNAWDNFIEGFQTPTTGYESNVWTGVGTTANITAAADSSAFATGKPDGACNQSWKVVLPTDGTATYVRGDLGALIDIDTIQTDLYFCLYVEVAPDSGESYLIFTAGTTVGVNNHQVSLANNTGVLQVRANGVSSSSYITIASGTWYTVKLSLDTAAAVGGSSITVWSGGSQTGTQTFQRNAGDIRYLYIGGVANIGVNDSGTLWFDLITVKTN